MVKKINTPVQLSEALGDRNYYSYDGLDFILSYYDENEEFDAVAINGVFTEYGNYSSFGGKCFIHDIGNSIYEYSDFINEWIDENTGCVSSEMTQEEKGKFADDILEDYIEYCVEHYSGLYRLNNGDVMLVK